MTDLVSAKKTFKYLLLSTFFITIIILISKDTLIHPLISDLDEAHHVATGIFFKDWIKDVFSLQTSLPDVQNYTLEYYKHYPVLGFLYWPPFFYFIEGIFFLFTENTLLMSRILIMIFAYLLMISLFMSYNRNNKSFLHACFASGIIIALPTIKQYINITFLDIPAIAMMQLSIFYYINLTNNKKELKYFSPIFLILSLALGIYIKQTAFIISFAIILDLLFVKRKFFIAHFRLIACYMLLLFVFILPLALFTLKFGKANIAQSIGSGTQLIMKDYKSLNRLSLENLLFYPKVFFIDFKTFSIPIILSFIYLFFNKDFFKKNSIYVFWIFSFYCFFTFFDNKSPRFALLCYPALIILAVSYIQQLNIKRLIKYISLSYLTFFFALNLFTQPKMPTFLNFDEIAYEISNYEDSGNVFYMGDYRQIFTFYSMIYKKSSYVLEGDNLLNNKKNASLAELCKRYRIKYLLIEEPYLNTIKKYLDTEHNSNFKLLKEDNYLKNNHAIPVYIYIYNGHFNKEMDEIQFDSPFLN